MHGLQWANHPHHQHCPNHGPSGYRSKGSPLRSTGSTPVRGASTSWAPHMRGDVRSDPGGRHFSIGYSSASFHVVIAFSRPRSDTGCRLKAHVHNFPMLLHFVLSLRVMDRNVSQPKRVPGIHVLDAPSCGRRFSNGRGRWPQQRYAAHPISFRIRTPFQPRVPALPCLTFSIPYRCEFACSHRPSDFVLWRCSPFS